MSKLTGQEEKVTDMARMYHQVKSFDDQDPTLEDPCILTDLLDLQATRPEWSKTWTIGMSMTNFGSVSPPHTLKCRSNKLTLHSAGHDTITSTLTSILYYISISPSALAHVRSEITRAINEGTVADPAINKPDTPYASYDNIIAALPFLSACIKEAMRLHPVIAMNMVRKVPASDTEINGYSIPAGTIVGVNPHAYNLNSAYFGADAHEFRPERWIEGEEDEAQATWDHYNLNWSGPSRTCPGQHMARLIMVKMLFVLFRSVRLEVVEQGGISKGFLGRMAGVKVRLVVDPVVGVSKRGENEVEVDGATAADAAIIGGLAEEK